MSVAERCGLGDPEGEVLRPAREAWARWSEQHPALNVVDDLVDFAGWTRSVSPSEANRMLGVLASLTATEPEAVTALVWALLPGAERVARRLADLHADIGGMVAGQLWVEASRAHRVRSVKVAAAILGQTRREVCAELGVGELADRRDRAMKCATGDPELLEKMPCLEREDHIGPLLAELFHNGLEEGAINGLDFWLLWALAAEADRQHVSAHRGRSGLTAPGVVEAVATQAGLAGRSLRTRAARALDRLGAYAEAREDPQRYAEWRAQHRRPDLTARDEMELALIEDEWGAFVMERPGMAFKRLTVAFNVVLGTRRRRTA